ncbi:MAG: sulfite dehydrogenase [Betaproteobacteria bacterium]
MSPRFRSRAFDASRRTFLRLLAAAGGAAAACRSGPEPLPSLLGAPIRPYGERSPFVRAVRLLEPGRTPEQADSLTPLADLFGTITPSSLHFERHHSGVPAIDPAAHRLLVHGLVDRPLVFTMDDLKRLPSISRVHFLECSGNSASGWRKTPQPTVQAAHGLTSCSEWTGVSLALLLEEVGVQPGAAWIVAEGADPAKMTRSIPLSKARDDALLAYAQNGEPLRPEQGFPLRLLLPGWEGNTNVKWLRRLKLVDQPVMGREETSKYTDLMPDGRARQFTFVMEAKSVVTRPSGSQRLARGFHEITGLAWSGRGRIARVEITTDAGATWKDADLQEPVLPMAHTRFRLAWEWDGRDAVIASRATDETGYRQPTRDELVAVRGLNSFYHNNMIQAWHVGSDGMVEYAVF